MIGLLASIMATVIVFTHHGHLGRGWVFVAGIGVGLNVAAFLVNHLDKRKKDSNECNG